MTLKNVIFIASILVLSCKPNLEKSELIIGTWNCISGFDFETQQTSFPENGEKLIAEFKSDSLYLYENNEDEADHILAWQIEGDSLILGNEISCFIKELNTKSFIVDYDIFGKHRITFIKID